MWTSMLAPISECASQLQSGELVARVGGKTVTDTNEALAAVSDLEAQFRKMVEQTDDFLQKIRGKTATLDDVLEYLAARIACEKGAERLSLVPAELLPGLDQE